MEVLYVKVGEKPKVIDIYNTLEHMQKLVGGHIEAAYFFDDPVAVVCNANSKILSMEPNRYVYDTDGSIMDVICGDFLVVGLGEEDFCGLSGEMIDKYMDIFMEVD